MPSPLHRLHTALTAQAELGLRVVPARWLALAEAAARQSDAWRATPEPSHRADPAPPAAGAGDDPRSTADLDRLAALAAGCTRCALAARRHHVVIGSGNPAARLLVVGEAPGADEDRAGLPFVGRAGKLLTDILAAIGLARDEVYIANVLKCRPPDNRNPEPEEVAACRPFLERQIELVAPEVILTLGTFAAHLVLDTTAPIGALRGRFHQRGATPVLPTYHPAYLLRNPQAKRPVWEDIQRLGRRLALPEPFPGERGSSPVEPAAG